jgi:hypothetical protein
VLQSSLEPSFLTFTYRYSLHRRYPDERATGAHLIEDGFKTVTISIDEIITATPTTGGTAVVRTNLQVHLSLSPPSPYPLVYLSLEIALSHLL